MASRIAQEISIHNDEELAWFRDNVVRAAAILGCCELRAGLYAARVCERGYQRLENPGLTTVKYCVCIDHSGSRCELDVRHDSVSVLSGVERALRWAVPEVGIEQETLTMAQAAEHLERKCRSQLTREIVQQNQELLRRLEAVNVAERATQVKSAFLANMSHELRTPMNSILGFTKRLIRRLDGTISPKDMGALQTVNRNGEALLDIINDILDFSKLEAGHDRLHIEETSLRDLVVDVIEQCKPLLDPGREILFRRTGVDPFCLRADETKLRRILLNLVSNAIKYGAQGPVDIELFREHDLRLGAVIVAKVRDHGPGISPEEQQQLFSPFRRLENENTRRVGGTGLGLTICSRYAKLHHGRIDVTSQVGKGAAFSLVVPLEHGEASQSSLAA